MTYSISEMRYILNLFNFLKKEKYNSIKIRKYLKDICKISLSTVYIWQYLDIFKTSFCRVTKRNTKITDEIKLFIIKTITENKLIRCKTLRKYVINKFNVFLSLRTIYTILHKNNITFKKVYYKNRKFNDEKYNKCKIEMDTKISSISNDNIISIDEMAVYTNEKSTYGWEVKGQKCEVITKNNLTQKRASLLLAMTNKRIISNELHEGSIDGDKYLKFIRKINYKHKGKYLLMDNARIHHTKKFKKYVEDKKINVIYNIPYSPEFNPIEHVNAMVRNRIKYNKNNTIKDIENTINTFKKEKNTEIYKKIFKKSFDRLKM